MRDAVQPGRKTPRIVQLTEVLVGFQKNVLRQVQSVFAVAGNSQKIVVDTLLPPGDEEVVSLHVAPGSLTNQVGIFDRPKDQISGSWWLDAVGRKKSDADVYSLAGFGRVGVFRRYNTGVVVRIWLALAVLCAGTA